MFNVSKDTQEEVNLAKDKPEIKDELKRKLHGWIQRATTQTVQTKGFNPSKKLKNHLSDLGYID